MFARGRWLYSNFSYPSDICLMHEKGIPVHALTRSYSRISRVITSPITVENTNSGAIEQTNGIWDTGATGSAITNFQGNTVMTFRVPSIQRLDFVAGIKSHTPIISNKIPGRNDPCSCGSGKKFKHCHGKNNP